MSHKEASAIRSQLSIPFVREADFVILPAGPVVTEAKIDRLGLVFINITIGERLLRFYRNLWKWQGLGNLAYIDLA